MRKAQLHFDRLLLYCWNRIALERIKRQDAESEESLPGTYRAPQSSKARDITALSTLVQSET